MDPSDPDGLVPAAARRARQDRQYERFVRADEKLARVIGRCTLFCGSPRSECPCPQTKSQ